jgi:xylan 1,4-beta-xylosidase
MPNACLIRSSQAEGHDAWAAGGDVIRLSARADAEAETQLAELDGRFWSIEIAAPFTGRVAGLFAERGTVHFADFRDHAEAGS